MSQTTKTIRTQRNRLVAQKLNIYDELSKTEMENITGGVDHQVGGSASCDTNGKCTFGLTYTIKF